MKARPPAVPEPNRRVPAGRLSGGRPEDRAAADVTAVDPVRASGSAIKTGRDEAPTSAETAVLRCHWVRLVDQPADVDPWVLIPGCEAMAQSPFETCGCDTLARRLTVQVEQRKELEQVIGGLRRTLRAWSKAGCGAWALLTGSPAPGHMWPEELAAAVARATRAAQQPKPQVEHPGLP